MSKVKDKSFYY